MIAFVALGGNVGDDPAIIGRFRAAQRHIADLTYIEKVELSRFYRSAPVGPVPDQPAFLNAVARLVGSGITPEILLADLLAIERTLGRVRDVRSGPRTIDLDLLFVDQLRRSTSQLTIPHPRWAQRAFVLMPLIDLVGRGWRAPSPEHGTVASLGELLDRALLAPDQSCDVAAVLDDDDNQAGQSQGKNRV